MITRNITRSTRITTKSRRISSVQTAPSGGGGGRSSQHPHAQIQDTFKAESNSISLPEQQESPAAEQISSNQEQNASQSSLSRAISIPIQENPSYPVPFNTHLFFRSLEATFPTPIARTLMTATRSLLIDRISRIRSISLDVKDLDNQAYLFRAALSELRTEATVRTKNATAGVGSTLGALKRDIEALGGGMKEKIGELRHEIQMEMDNHRNESRANMKAHDIRMEEVAHSALVKISDIRTEIEQAKWDNTRRGVAIFSAFVVLVILAMELKPAQKKPSPPNVAISTESEGNLVGSTT